jgi:hypothetical protein
LGLSCSSESFMRFGISSIGLTRSHLDLMVSHWSSRSSRSCRPPSRLRGPVSSSHELASPSEYMPALNPFTSNDSKRLPWVFFLLRDISEASPLRGRLPNPTFVPPSAFLTLPTGYSLPHLASLFHLAATSKVPSSGALARQPADLARHAVVPSRRYRLFPAMPKSIAPGSATPSSGLWSGCRSVATDKWFRLADARSPLEFSLLRVLLRTPWRRRRASSARDLSCRFLA